MTQPHLRTAFDKFLRCDPAGFDELRILADVQPTETARALRDFLLNRELHDYTDELIRILVEIEGSMDVESWISHGWPEFSIETRGKIIYPWLHDPDGMSTDLAIQLFDNPSSTVRDRHRIVAGLVVTARERGIPSLVLNMVSRIGKYDEPRQQTALEEFIADARTNLTTQQ